MLNLKIIGNKTTVESTKTGNKIEIFDSDIEYINHLDEQIKNGITFDEIRREIVLNSNIKVKENFNK